MNNSCPTCSQKLPKDLPLHVDLEVNVAVANGVAVGLTGKQAELLSLIASTGVRLASYEFLIENLYLLDDRDTEILKVMVCHLRRKIAPLGISIETIWGKGYKIRNLRGKAA